MQKIQNYINGELVSPINDEYIENHNPATGEVYSLLPNSDHRDVQRAVDASNKAFPVWSSMPVRDRSDYLLRISALIDSNLNRLALAESVDNGKPGWLARSVDIPRASQNFNFFATAIQHFASEAHLTDNVALNYTRRDPIGIVGCISPWNLPIYLFTWKIAPALAAGNCVVAKPSELTPMTAFMLAELCIEAGLPAGVLNIIHGYGHTVGRAITSHPEIKAISFTGGTKTGNDIAATAAPMFKKLSLELGGKNPTIVFSDCDFHETVKSVVRSSFSNQGEICLCGSRILIERSIYAKFRQAFVSRVKALRVGDPLQEDIQQGALVSKGHLEKVLSYIRLAKEEGGVILCGGERVIIEGRCEKGWYVAPTVIEGLPFDCRTNQEEIFGPVVTLIPFETEEEAVHMANGTPYGLASSIWTQNLSRAHRIAHQIQAGIVWINCWMLRDLRTPFGGMKNSGVGREGGFEALRFFTEAKNICVKM